MQTKCWWEEINSWERMEESMWDMEKSGFLLSEYFHYSCKTLTVNTPSKQKSALCDLGALSEFYSNRLLWDTTGDKYKHVIIIVGGDSPFVQCLYLQKRDLVAHGNVCLCTITESFSLVL